MKTLIVEDTEDSRILIEDVLRNSGDEVLSAKNGAEALLICHRDKPELIVSDILMPEMDGYQLCREIRHDENLRDIPFIFYTATYTDSSDERLAMSLGADGFIVKPKDPDQLLAAIKEILSKRSLSSKSSSTEVKEATLDYLHIEALNKKLYAKVIQLEKQEQELKLASLVFQHSRQGMLVTDNNNLIIAANPAFTQITGYELEEVMGKNPRIFSSDRHDDAFFDRMWERIQQTGSWQGEIWDQRKNGEVYPNWLDINTIRNEDGSIHRYVALFNDITEKKQSENLIWRQAHYDTLTGLPNRHMFRKKLEDVLLSAEQHDQPVALLLLDLDQFKEVNDTLGHDVGDTLLQEVTRRLCRCTNDDHILARLGGDEFAIIMPSPNDHLEIEGLSKKMMATISKPYQLGQNVVYISGSIGITLYPEDSKNIDVLIKDADQAMYAAKNKGRNRFSYFTPSLQEANEDRLYLGNDLRQALSKNQLEVYYQPIIDLSSGKIIKAEALLRWNHPDRGMISPLQFIPLAEEIGLINVIGDWVFKQAVTSAKQWIGSYDRDFQISINVSPVQFKPEYQHFIQEWLTLLADLAVIGENIIIEITEGFLLDPNSHVLNRLFTLRDAGIKIAIDDFGTGYSSLSYLKKFDLDYLKIDRSFISNLETDENDVALSEAIIVMSNKLGLEVIAEGVETEGQQSMLINAGCHYAQGYLYSKPVPASTFSELLEKNSTSTSMA